MVLTSGSECEPAASITDDLIRLVRPSDGLFSPLEPMHGRSITTYQNQQRYYSLWNILWLTSTCSACSIILVSRATRGLTARFLFDAHHISEPRPLKSDTDLCAWPQWQLQSECILASTFGAAVFAHYIKSDTLSRHASHINICMPRISSLFIQHDGIKLVHNFGRRFIGFNRCELM